jgi:hypothetical protein
MTECGNVAVAAFLPGAVKSAIEDVDANGFLTFPLAMSKTESKPPRFLEEFTSV